LGGTFATTCTKSNGSTSGTCTTTVTSPTSVKTETYDLSKYDTTACATMIAIASDASKFYSTDGNTKCVSAANPNFTDLVSIFNNVAASIMKKRRIPSSTT
jgi:iron only hydrogenase large subunit-like protein